MTFFDHDESIAIDDLIVCVEKRGLKVRYTPQKAPSSRAKSNGCRSFVLKLAVCQGLTIAFLSGNFIDVFLMQKAVEHTTILPRPNLDPIDFPAPR
jgi:hypothetical protein